MQFDFTEAAANKIAELILEENNPNLKLRVFVQGGGCSGFSYGFAFDETVNEDDFSVEKNGVTIIVDAMSMQYIAGSTINFKEELMGASFEIDNPQASSTCGCGSSFSYEDPYDNVFDDRE